MNEIIRKLSLAGNKRPVTNKDMSQIENKLGIVIPDDMKAFYLCLNGTGVLGLDVECMFHSPITGLDYEISHFISFKYGGAQFCVKITFFQVLYSACFQCICGIAGLDINNTLESQYNIR